MSVTIYVSHGGQPRAHLAIREGDVADPWLFLGAELARAAEEELDHLDIRIRGVLPRPPSVAEARAALDAADVVEAPKRARGANGRFLPASTAEG